MKVLIIVVVIVLMSGCTTMRPLKEDLSKHEIVSAIQPGDQVKIVTKTGSQHFIKVSSITLDTIIGEEKQFKLEDIERIEIKKLTAAGIVAGTTIAIGFGIAIQYLIIAFIFAISGL